MTRTEFGVIGSLELCIDALLLLVYPELNSVHPNGIGKNRRILDHPGGPRRYRPSGDLRFLQGLVLFMQGRGMVLCSPFGKIVRIPEDFGPPKGAASLSDLG